MGHKIYYNAILCAARLLDDMCKCKFKRILLILGTFMSLL